MSNDDTARLTHTLSRHRANSAKAWGTIACASATDPSASASARCAPCSTLPLHLVICRSVPLIDVPHQLLTVASLVTRADRARYK